MDFVKIKILNINIQRLLRSQKLNFKTKVSESTGLLDTLKVCEYHFCKIRIYESGLVLFTGSIHKMYNSLIGTKAPNYLNGRSYKGFNGNDFNIDQMLFIRDHLIEIFQCKANNMIFQNIEFGLNIVLPFFPIQFIKGLLYHKAKPFEFRFENHYAQVKHNRYLIKIYDKSWQYGIENNVLRVEVKLMKSIEIKKLGITSFADIDNQTLANALKMVLNKFDEVIYYDYSIRKAELNKTDKRKLNSFSNPKFFLFQVDANRRDRPLKKLNEIIYMHSDNLKETIKRKFIEKCVTINKKNNELGCVIIHCAKKNIECLINTHSYIEFINTCKRLRICPETFYDISEQKEESIYLSISRIRYFQKYDKLKYEKLKLRYLTGKWINSSVEKQIEEIAHNIRDTTRTKKRKLQRLYPANQHKIFDIGPLFKIKIQSTIICNRVNRF